MKKAVLIICALICFIIPIAGYANLIAKTIKFNANCGDYLKLAADATNIEIAEKHLSKAISYLEEKNLTDGYTKIFVYQPINDIGIWYENLKNAQIQLQEMKAKEVTELEESNALMKLRETILNNDGLVTHPLGISVANNFTSVFWFNCTSWLLFILGGVLFMVESDFYY